MNEHDFLFYLAFGTNAGAILYAAASTISFEIEKRNRWLKIDYEREFGLKPPEYLSQREIGNQLAVRRQIGNPVKLM